MTYNNDEFAGLNTMEKKVVKLSIKYQIDLMSMTLKDAKKFLSQDDWQDLHDFMKNGCREKVLH